MSSHVLIADDHPLFRAAMCQALAGIVGPSPLQAASVEETLSLLAEDENVDLVFLDVKMPGNEGLTGLSEIRSRFPNVLIVIVSAHDDPVLIHKAIDLGACGYIPKSSSLETISAAVTQILDGEQWLPADMSMPVVNTEDVNNQQLADRIALLTPHQFKVLKLLSRGMLNKQIAYELTISESTVKQHVSAILRKLNMMNRTKAGVAFRHMMDVE